MKLKKSLFLTLVGHQLNLGDEAWATTLFVSPSLLSFFIFIIYLWSSTLNKTYTVGVKNDTTYMEILCR